MKRIFTLFISLLLIFSLVSCEFPSITPFTGGDENKKNEGTISPTENSSPQTSTTNNLKNFEFSKYFPSKEGKTLTLSQGKDKIDALYVTQYIGNNKIQILEVNGSRSQTIYEFEGNSVYLIYKKEMTNSEAPVNMTLSKSDNQNKVLFLKGPLTTGTKWSDNDNNSFEITGVDKACVTKAGEFKTLEITITNSKDKTITKNYFGENLGLIKSVTRNEKDEIITLHQLISVE